MGLVFKQCLSGCLVAAVTRACSLWIRGKTCKYENVLVSAGLSLCFSNITIYSTERLSPYGSCNCPPPPQPPQGQAAISNGCIDDSMTEAPMPHCSLSSLHLCTTVHYRFVWVVNIRFVKLVKKISPSEYSMFFFSVTSSELWLSSGKIGDFKRLHIC